MDISIIVNRNTWRLTILIIPTSNIIGNHSSIGPTHPSIIYIHNFSISSPFSIGRIIPNNVYISVFIRSDARKITFTIIPPIDVRNNCRIRPTCCGIIGIHYFSISSPFTICFIIPDNM